MLRDKLLARMREMGESPDHVRLASEVLGIRGATEALARRLVSQALVMEERQDAWRRSGERICREAPAVSGVYVLRDEVGSALYVGKAVNLRRRLRTHFAERRWRATKPVLARAADAEWRIVGSELEALLREADLICRLNPIVNVQREIANAPKRAIPAALVRDVIVIVPSVEADSVELVGARAEGRWMIQRTRRNGADLAVHVSRLRKFFVRTDETGAGRAAGARVNQETRLAPIVFSWLAGRGRSATRLDPHDARMPRDLRERLAALFADERLFADRLVIYS